MPAYLSSANMSDAFQLDRERPSGMTISIPPRRSAQHIHIGLVNNMPDGAIEATERQFVSLLAEASGEIPVTLHLYSLPGIPRLESAANHIRAHYAGIDELWNTHLDGIIVTGREPVTANLRDEPYWGSFTNLLDWARENTYSAIWSCLAAHAAVLYCDGIDRVRSDSKKCGIFDCTQTEYDGLTTGIGASFKLPHSRWNGVPELALTRCGYRVLSRSAAGVDTFIKQYNSLFVFFQGHPEYDANTLMLEYRRDVGRFFRGESDRYPSLPLNYFDRPTAALLENLQKQAVKHPSSELLTEAHWILSEARVEAPWRLAATSMYRNWLRYLSDQKEIHLISTGGAAQTQGNKASMVAIDAVEATIPNFYAKKRSHPEERPRRVAAAR